MHIQTLFDNLTVDGTRAEFQKFDAAYKTACNVPHETDEPKFQKALSELAVHAEGAGHQNPTLVHSMIGNVLYGECSEGYDITPRVRENLVKQESLLAAVIGSEAIDRSVKQPRPVFNFI